MSLLRYNAHVSRHRRHARRRVTKKTKSAKHNHVSATPLDCQLEPQSGEQTRNTYSATPTSAGGNDGGTMRNSNGGLGIAKGDLGQDIDDADPDIIPNQYGE